MCLCYSVSCIINDVVDTAEVVDCLNNIVNAGVLCSDAEGVCLKDIASLLLGKAAALHVVGIVCEVYLSVVIDASFQFACLLLPQTREQR